VYDDTDDDRMHKSMHAFGKTLDASSSTNHTHRKTQMNIYSKELRQADSMKNCDPKFSAGFIFTEKDNQKKRKMLIYCEFHS
jgi:hypothetical protein